jgi:hypothetical protein
MSQEQYPRLQQIGCVVVTEPVEHIPWTELNDKLGLAGLDRERFSDLFGVQTCHAGGPYPWDVEAVLERMMSGKLTGTQKYWD